MPPRTPLRLLRSRPLQPHQSHQPHLRPYSTDSPFSKYATTPIPRRRPDPSLPRPAFDAGALFAREGRPNGPNRYPGNKPPHNPGLQGLNLQGVGDRFGPQREEDSFGAPRISRGERGGAGERERERLPTAPQVPGINPRFAAERNGEIVPSAQGTIQLLAEDGENKGEILLRNVLARINLRTHVLQKVDERKILNKSIPPVGTEGREEVIEMLRAEGREVESVIPICRMYSFEQLKAQAQQHYQEMRAKKKEKQGKKKAGNEKKEFRMSWGINAHDLAYRFKQIGDYIDDGARVEIVLVFKRGMAKVEKAQMELLLGKIKDFMAERNANMQSEDGIVGKIYMMTFQGKRLTEEEKQRAERKREAAARERMETTGEPALAEAAPAETAV